MAAEPIDLDGLEALINNACRSLIEQVYALAGASAEAGRRVKQNDHDNDGNLASEGDHSSMLAALADRRGALLGGHDTSPFGLTPPDDAPLSTTDRGLTVPGITADAERDIRYLAQEKQTTVGGMVLPGEPMSTKAELIALMNSDIHSMLLHNKITRDKRTLINGLALPD